MNSLPQLGDDFWAWRAATQPRSADDIPRIERPAQWRPDWSPDAVQARRGRTSEFEARWKALDVSAAPIEDRVEHRLLRSALARVRWELDVLAMWRRQPRFYVDQTIGEVFELLTPPSPDLERVRTVLRTIPETLGHARTNLAGQAVAAFARATIEELADIRGQLDEVAAGLDPSLTPEFTTAGAELAAYRDWLIEQEPAMRPVEAVGRSAFEAFLRDVAVLPYSVEELLAIARQEFDRAVALEAVERNRNRDVPVPPLPADSAAQGELEKAAEQSVRDFYERHDLLSQPASLRHYRWLPMPAYLAPIAWLGVTDDLTGPSRLDQDGVSYLPEPSEDLPYFYAANARDPRCGIAHEGVHYQQLALSWRNPRPLRRWYYDSVPNEGIAFYNEELMLAAGLFDDAPHSREIIYNFMRLRALRVELDVLLAIGELDVHGAEAFLMEKVPMDKATALQEATFFASFPGQAMTYQVGKTQILRFVADAMRREGMNLRDVHDYLWRNGNVPIALLRAEFLDLHDDWDAADTKADSERGSTTI
ncbi:DUF885 family protein [Actinoplanes sp. NPDC026619]|uniref:DUF885 family protein n=1 Tax=Actinoplanes sp. NPDC026619 TaxID=3155798 RepID=UPI0033EB3FFC